VRAGIVTREMRRGMVAPAVLGRPLVIAASDLRRGAAID